MQMQMQIVRNTLYDVEESGEDMYRYVYVGMNRRWGEMYDSWTDTLCYALSSTFPFSKTHSPSNFQTSTAKFSSAYKRPPLHSYRFALKSMR